MNWDDLMATVCRVTEKQARSIDETQEALKEKPKSLVVVSVSNFDSDTFCFPASDERFVFPTVTITDPRRGTIRFSTLQS